jgi:hypothetical protein
MVDHTKVKLGIKGIKRDSRTLKASRYMQALPPAPPARDWTKGIVDWGMMMNDTLGDCTIAGIGHAVQVWSANATASEITVTDPTVESYYEKWDGYIPGDADTDNGGIELDVLKDWKQDTFDGHVLMAFASVNPSNLEEVRQAINLFGGLYIGVELPLSAQNQTVWDAATGEAGLAGSWGGHCIFVPKYTPTTLTCITWGALQDMTNAFWTTYVSEAYALISPVFIESNTDAPSGFGLVALQDDLAQIR